MLAKCKKSVEKSCGRGLSYKAVTGWRDCVAINTPCTRCEGMECTNQGVNDSHSAGIHSPVGQDEGRACREQTEEDHASLTCKRCAPGPGQRDLNARRVRLFWFAVSLRRQGLSPSSFKAHTIPRSGDVDDGLWRLWQRCCVCLASHTLPWQIRVFHWLILPGLLPWLLTPPHRPPVLTTNTTTLPIYNSWNAAILIKPQMFGLLLWNFLSQNKWSH